MATDQSTARIDLGDPQHGENLQRILQGSPLIGSVWLGSVAGTGMLVAEAGAAPTQVADGAPARLARRLFGLVPDPGWESELIPAQVQAITLSRQTILFKEAENLLVRRCTDQADRALLISVSNTLSPAAAQALSLRLSAGAGTGNLQDLLAGSGDVLAGAVLQLPAGELVATYRRADDASKIRLNAALGRALAEALSGILQPADKSLIAIAAHSMERVTRVDIESDGQLHTVAQVPMVPEAVFGLQASVGIDMDILRRVQRDALNDALRCAIGALLEAGLSTQIVPFPSTDTEFLAIVDELRHLPEDDLIARLDIGGFANHGFGEGEDFQQCKECIYYLPHRKWCDIPELPLPVEAHWWCRLWKL